jgi:hypothetical protein
LAYKPITDQQVRPYLSDLQNQSQRTSAARAGFSERTARRFDADPLEGFWEDDLLPLLDKDSALQAVTLLRHLQSKHPLAFPDDRIRRTLERRVRQWQALKGPERDIIFRQTPEPGYMAQSDFTHADELGVTTAGQPFAHLLYHFVLVYSRWGHVGVVLGGESFSALAENLQQALWTSADSRPAACAVSAANSDRAGGSVCKYTQIPAVREQANSRSRRESD